MEKASEFCLKGINDKGEEITLCLKDFLGKGKDIILYFYPKDNTPGCTMEAKDFKDKIDFFTDKAFIIGISPDSIKSHKNFMEKHSLNFPLLSDSELGVIKEYGAYGEKNLYGKKTLGVIRTTYIIDEKGYVKKVWKNVKAKGHVEDIIRFYKKA